MVKLTHFNICGKLPYRMHFLVLLPADTTPRAHSKFIKPGPILWSSQSPTVGGEARARTPVSWQTDSHQPGREHKALVQDQKTAMTDDPISDEFRTCATGNCRDRPAYVISRLHSCTCTRIGFRFLSLYVSVEFENQSLLKTPPLSAFSVSFRVQKVQL